MHRPRALPPLLAFLVPVLLAASPAAAQEGTPAAGAPGVLLDVAIGAEAVPADLNEVYLLRSTIEPGVALAYPEGYNPPNGLGQLLVAGRLAIRPAGDALLWRAGADPSGPGAPVATGTEVLLGAGDASVVPRLPVEAAGEDAQGDIRNPGAEPAVAVGFTFRPAAWPGTIPPHRTFAFEVEGTTDRGYLARLSAGDRGIVVALRGTAGVELAEMETLTRMHMECLEAGRCG